MPNIDLSTFKNSRLLQFVLALSATRSNPLIGHQARSGFDHLEFQIAAQVALHAGVASGPAHDLELTPAGLKWAATQLMGASLILAANAEADLCEVPA